jgi:hypothetical protein
VSPSQHLAIDALVLGGTDSEAATAASVTRETVCRWRHADADFIAALNRARQATFETVRDKAVTTLTKLLDDLDGALRLKAVTVILAHGGAAAGPTDAEEIRTREAEARGEQASRVFRSQML